MKFFQASKLFMCDASHAWLIIANETDLSEFDDVFQQLDLSVDADIVVVHEDGKFYDIFVTTSEDKC